MHKKMHVKLKINEKRKGIMDISAYREKNLARNKEENDKKICYGALSREREREESLKTFEKGELNKSRSDF